ncbi:MAG TPA: FAD-binding oxidoreductase [Alphaproteobacteria bacterium]
MNDVFFSELRQIVGPDYCLTKPDDIAPYVQEWRGRYHGDALAVVRPANPYEIADIIKLCAAHHVPIVPQGGNTGLVGGSVPIERKDAVVISTGRLNHILDIDADNFTMTVEAGCILQTIQNAAKDANRYFPLSLGAEGSCQIGGNIATNAGGILALRYGVMRDLILGLEVVLPNGEIWTNLRRLRKDNSGYDLKQLFIGSEGTLGIITKAVLKLFSLPQQRETFFIALPDVQTAVNIFNTLRSQIGENILACELMCDGNLEYCDMFGPAIIRPLQENAPWYLLMETMNTDRAIIEQFLTGQFEQQLILDAVIAESEQQRQQLWFIREAIVEAQRRAGGAIKHDISVPVSTLPAFLDEAVPLIAQLLPGARALPFGHVGDGNLHFNIGKPLGSNDDDFVAQWDDINHAVHAIVLRYNGSIAAEHGVGTFKRDELTTSKSPIEMQLMRQIKQTLDPLNIMNPGVVLKI